MNYNPFGFRFSGFRVYIIGVEVDLDYVGSGCYYRWQEVQGIGHRVSRITTALVHQGCAITISNSDKVARASADITTNINRKVGELKS